MGNYILRQGLRHSNKLEEGMLPKINMEAKNDEAIKLKVIIYKYKQFYYSFYILRQEN